MAYRLASPNIQFLSALGEPLAGGFLYFYITGTTTPANTYADNGLTTPNPNPIVLDSAGYAGSIFLTPTQQYKVVLTDANGVQQWTMDPVSDPTSSNETIATSLSITDAASATKSLFFQTEAVDRWGLISDGEPETGSNAGSNFLLNSYSDAGSVISTILEINRASGLVTFNTPTNFIDFPQVNGIQLIPPGMFGSFAGDTAPAGWLICDGSAVSRTTYAALFAYIGTLWGSGDGSTTFNLPNAEGEFLRGWNPSASVGPDAGRTFGSTQANSVQPLGASVTNGSGSPVYGSLTPNTIGAQNNVNVNPLNGPGANIVVTITGTGSETRPTNITALICIKT